MDSNLINIIVGLFTLFFNINATHLRNSKRFTYKLRWQISIILAIIGVVGLFFVSRLISVWLALTTPLIFTSIDKILMIISYKFQNRDFQFNTSLEVWLNQHKYGISMWDNIITLVSLLLITGLFIFSMTISKI